MDCLTSAALTVGLSGFRTLVSRIIVSATIISSILFVQIPVFAHFLNLHSLSLKDWFMVLFSSFLTIALTKI